MTRPGRYSWLLVALLWVSSLLKAADRSILVATTPQIRDEFGLSATQRALVSPHFLGPVPSPPSSLGRRATRPGARVSSPMASSFGASRRASRCCSQFAGAGIGALVAGLIAGRFRPARAFLVFAAVGVVRAFVLIRYFKDHGEAAPREAVAAADDLTGSAPLGSATINRAGFPSVPFGGAMA